MEPRKGHLPGRWGVWGLVGLAGLLLAASGLVLARSQPVARPGATGEAPPPAVATPAPAPAPVRVARVRRGDLSLRKEATGYLEARRTLEVSAEISGRVLERPVEEGERVQAGQLLVRLDDRDLRMEIQEAEAEWLKSRALYAVHYENDLREGEVSPAAPESPADPASSEALVRDRAGRLYEEGLISRQAFLEARRSQAEEGTTAELLAGARQREVRAASSGLVQAEQRLARARLAHERTRILAPFAGRVADLAVEVGQRVAPGEPLLTLLEDDRLKLEVDVLESDVVRLQPGAPARLRVPALEGLPAGTDPEGTRLQGKVATINPRVDAETGTGRVTVTLANPRGRLLPGLFAYVELEMGRLPERLLVPESALLERQGRELVMRVEEGRALWAYVETGERSGGQVEILAGLEAGDRVTVDGHFALAHEALVEVVEGPGSEVEPGRAPGTEPVDGENRGEGS